MAIVYFPNESLKQYTLGRQEEQNWMETALVFLETWLKHVAAQLRLVIAQLSIIWTMGLASHTTWGLSRRRGCIQERGACSISFHLGGLQLCLAPRIQM